MCRRFALLLVACCIAATPATAQDRKIRFNAGGGFTGTYGNAVEHNGTGSHFNAGIIVAITPTISLQGEYAWNGFKTTAVPIAVSPTPFSVPTSTDFLVDGNMQYGDFNVLLHPSYRGKVHPYAVTGIGVYYRPVTISSTATGYATVCDPYLYACSPSPVSVSQVTGLRSSTDFGVNFGGGVDVKLNERTSIYIETRYHYVWGPIVDQQSVPAGMHPTSLAANGEFMPITVGIRF